ncbi:MAG: hypothetical protein ACK47B_13335 [Armatimonadota bacterium]
MSDREECSWLPEALALADEVLPPHRSGEVTRHLERCRVCRQAVDELEKVSHLVRRADPAWEAPSADAMRERLVGRAAASLPPRRKAAFTWTVLARLQPAPRRWAVAATAVAAAAGAYLATLPKGTGTDTRQTAVERTAETPAVPVPHPDVAPPEVPVEPERVVAATPIEAAPPRRKHRPSPRVRRPRQVAVREPRPEPRRVTERPQRQPAPGPAPELTWPEPPGGTGEHVVIQAEGPLSPPARETISVTIRADEDASRASVVVVRTREEETQ